MAADILFTEAEMAIDEGLGYPRAYAKLCQDRSFGPYSHGPPFTFTPYALHKQEASKAKELHEMFPVMDPKVKSTTKPKIFVSLLWKQLSHLGNAGFDPAVFRVDPYGNVLYYHADSASPLAWDIDHWFPCSRGGLTVPSNLRILQWQVCKKKHDKMEFLIPWWDLQMGISINQFLSVFASSNSDFRQRAFSLLFSEGENQELNASQAVDSHNFPQHFMESKEEVGLAPAAIVVSRRQSFEASTALKSLDYNRRPRSNIPIIAANKLKPASMKENENPDLVSNPYQAVVLARDSLRQKETATKMQEELQKLDDEVNDLKQKTEEEKVEIQDLELLLIKRRRRAEKCRRLSEAQSSYRATLEKMIRDAMHQSVIYKEQARLNQAATSALMARLEAQKAICDSSEKELHRKFRQRDEIEKQIRPQWENGRKRSRMDESLLDDKEEDDNTVLCLPSNIPGTDFQKEIADRLWKEREEKTILYLPGIKPETPTHKELRVFLEEEHKASEAGMSLKEERVQEERAEEERKQTVNNTSRVKHKESNKLIEAAADENPIEDKLKYLSKGEGDKICNIKFTGVREPEPEEDEESRILRGKGNVEKWLQMLEEEEDTQEDINLNPQHANESGTADTITKLFLKYPQEEIKILRFPEAKDKEEGVRAGGGGDHLKEETVDDDGSRKKETIAMETKSPFFKNPPYKLTSKKSNAKEVVDWGSKGVAAVGVSNSFEGKRNGKERGGLQRSESARAFRRIPSSPSIIVGMKKGVDCIRKKPLVIDDDDEDEDKNYAKAARNKFIQSSIKTTKKAVQI